jgi:hypothetical protein
MKGGNIVINYSSFGATLMSSGVSDLGEP